MPLERLPIFRLWIGVVFAIAECWPDSFLRQHVELKRPTLQAT